MGIALAVILTILVFITICVLVFSELNTQYTYEIVTPPNPTIVRSAEYKLLESINVEEYKCDRVSNFYEHPIGIMLTPNSASIFNDAGYYTLSTKESKLIYSKVDTEYKELKKKKVLAELSKGLMNDTSVATNRVGLLPEPERQEFYTFLASDYQNKNTKTRRGIA